MKTLVLSAACLLAGVSATHAQEQRQEHKAALVRLWATDTVLRVPESVLFDAGRNELFVSNIEGKGNEKDGQGFISRLKPDGSVIKLRWVSGLNAPKGMGKHGNRLYVADLDQVVVIDIAKGKIEQRIPVEGAVFLNDITIDKDGVVYISDTRTRKLHQLKNGQVTTLLEELKGPNGLLARPDAFYVLDGGTMYRLEKDRTLARLVDIEKGTDGIEQVGPGEFIVSCWQGEVFYVNTGSGTAVKLLDTQAQQLNTADIGYDPRKKIVFVPTFNGNSVVAYQLKL